MPDKPIKSNPYKDKIYEVIFEAETPSGKAFDVLLLVTIGLSILSVSLESVSSFSEKYGEILRYLEWFVTVLFTMEYVLRIYCVRFPKNYIFSFYGIIDLLAILPAYLSFFFTGTHSLAVIRAIRLMRAFRIFKLHRFLGEAGALQSALLASMAKIIVFLSAVCALTIIFGSVMYLVEGPENGFTSIPRAMYWTIVTLTTVGYGDISPNTTLGQILASFLMICGYGIIAIPTGIVAGEMAARGASNFKTTHTCKECNKEGHSSDARFCKYCGSNFTEST